MSTSSSSLPALVPGQTRIRDRDGFVATVVYVGPVASAKNSKEVYAGVVWDDPSRGKHDGSVVCRTTNQVVRHFGGCGPTQGSFLKVSKLDRGLPLTAELLKEKYVAMQAPVIAPNNLLPHTARTSKGLEKPIEFLGELQIRRRQQLEDIHKISLRREGISWAPTESEKGSLTASYGENIRDIDLAGNLLSDWEEVLKIAREFPNLTDYSVAFNRIRDVQLPVSSFDGIKVLNLKSCGIQSFETVLWVSQSMPNIESLCIASSDLSNMKDYEALEGLEQLKIIDCSDCKLDSWDEQVQKVLGKLPNLQQLSLDDNPIPSIPQHSSEDTIFPKLSALQLAGTSISSWTDLEGINNGLPNLRSLRFKMTPLTSTLGKGEVRFLSVARIPNLDYFNGSVISTQERVEAERRYLTLVSHLLNKTEAEQVATSSSEEEAKVAKESILAEHPQFDRLREVHKTLVLPQANGSASNGGNTLASTVCNVTISSMAASSCSMEPLVRRLPGSLTVGRLKALCGRAFGLDLDLMSLHFRTQADAFPVELDNDDNSLLYYGVCDGAEILMNEIDVEAQRRETERIKVEQEARMLQQERDATAIQELRRKAQS